MEQDKIRRSNLIRKFVSPGRGANKGIRQWNRWSYLYFLHGIPLFRLLTTRVPANCHHSGQWKGLCFHFLFLFWINFCRWLWNHLLSAGKRAIIWAAQRTCHVDDQPNGSRWRWHFNCPGLCVSSKEILFSQLLWRKLQDIKVTAWESGIWHLHQAQYHQRSTACTFCGWPRKLDNLTWCKIPVN